MNQSDKLTQHLDAIATAAIDLNLNIPVNISPDINKKANALETALIDAGYNPRKKIK